MAKINTVELKATLKGLKEERKPLADTVKGIEKDLKTAQKALAKKDAEILKVTDKIESAKEA
jgi:hypothetical protein